ncbi:hypothetical protein B0H10DRAFT_2244129 [Mycena sp. CBHHK59/15]|nr:hypothetical protein B0H10DRAFT_2244129 [Mycena sp. CBHHK59/15]
MARHEVVPSTSTVVPADAIDPANLMVVLLDDEELTFDYTRVPNPPNIHFSGDIPRLFREWESSTLLIVNGRGIAIKYWPLFYRRRKQGLNHKNGAWDKIRTVWGNWKFLVEERQRFQSEEQFWRKYTTADNAHLRYQQILDALKEVRESQEKSDADAARRFFDNNLDHPDADGAFAYTKSGQRRIKEKDSAVAEIWRELLANNADIARRWAAGRPTMAAEDFAREASQARDVTVTGARGNRPSKAIKRTRLETRDVAVRTVNPPEEDGDLEQGIGGAITNTAPVLCGSANHY